MISKQFFGVLGGISKILTTSKVYSVVFIPVKETSYSKKLYCFTKTVQQRKSIGFHYNDRKIHAKWYQ